MRMKKLSIVVPTYNEKDNVKRLVEEIEIALRGIEYEIIFVDDSTDTTPAVLEELSKNDMRIRFEHRTEEKGLATAVIRGFQIADGEFLACMEADLQHPPTILRPMYVALMSGADFCIPSRYIPGGSDGGLNMYRKIVSGTARWIGKLLLPCLRKVSDPTSGLFMFRRSCIKDADLKPIGWKIMIEVLAMGKYAHIIEIPYIFQERDAGKSKLSSKVTFQYLEQVLGLVFRATKRKGIKVTRWSQKYMNDMCTKYYDEV